MYDFGDVLFADATFPCYEDSQVGRSDCDGSFQSSVQRRVIPDDVVFVLQSLEILRIHILDIV